MNIINSIEQKISPEERARMNEYNKQYRKKNVSPEKKAYLKKLPLFTRAEMYEHISRSGKNIALKEHHSVPTSLRKAKTLLKMNTCTI